MANFFMAAVLATTAAVSGAVAYSSVQPGEELEQPTAMISTGAKSWLVSQLGSNQTCRITGRSLEDAWLKIQGEPVTLSAKCGSQFPALKSAVLLFKDKEGNTHLKNAEGKTLVEFASAEQWAQESIYPRSVMMTLEPGS